MDDRWTRFLAGSVASAAAETVTLPIDITKVRLQSQGMMLRSRTSSSSIQSHKPYSGMINALVRISVEEGPQSLWKGLTPALLRQSKTPSSLNMSR